MQQPRFMRVREVAAELGLSRSRVYALVHLNRIPTIREGKHIRFPRAAFEQWMQERIETALASVRKSPATQSEIALLDPNDDNPDGEVPGA